LIELEQLFWKKNAFSAGTFLGSEKIVLKEHVQKIGA
jgi:hypothetical protein